MSNELNLSPQSINNEGNWGAFVYQLNNEVYLGDMDRRFKDLKFIARFQPILAAKIICGCFLPQEEEKAYILPKLLEICRFDYRSHLTQEQLDKYANPIKETIREKKEAAQYAARFGVVVCYKCGSDCQNGKNHIAQNVAMGSDFYGENSDPTGRTFSQTPATNETLTFHNPKTTYQCTNPRCGHTFTVVNSQNTALTVAENPQNSTTLIVGLDPANPTQMVAITRDNATGLITDVTNEKPEDDECTMYLVQKVTIKGAGKLDGVQVLDLLKDACNLPETRETRENAGVTFEFWDAQLYENLNDYED